MLALVMPAFVHAQELGPLALDDAVGYALAHHPTVKAQLAATEVQRAQVSVARAGYLPQVDASAQIDVGTGNVLRGPLFPTPNIPAVSGPPTGRSWTDVSGGALFGVGASWDALGLVDQIAEVDAALAGERQARAGIAVQRLTVAYAAADQFLDLLSQDEIVRAAKANVDRSKALETIVEVLVAQQLRPGADASRAQAEEAIAVTQLIRAQQADAVSRTALARALGAAGHTVTVKVGDLLSPPPVMTRPEGRTVNPLLAQADAAVRAADAHERAVELQYLPRLNLFASLWVRGSGLSNGTTAGSLPPSAADGFAPDTPNWAAGIVLTWPALDIVATHARARAAKAQLEVARAQQTDVQQAVQSQIDTAKNVLEAARRVATNTPIALNAARAAESQATARYRAGLASVVEVAEAQRLLAQAEADDAVARLNVRRAELLLARAIGDLEPFFAESRAGGR